MSSTLLKSKYKKQAAEVGLSVLSLVSLFNFTMIFRCRHCHAFVTQNEGDHRRHTCPCHVDVNGELLHMNKDKSASFTHGYLFLYRLLRGHRPEPFDRDAPVDNNQQHRQQR